LSIVYWQLKKSRAMPGEISANDTLEIFNDHFSIMNLISSELSIPAKDRKLIEC